MSGNMIHPPRTMAPGVEAVEGVEKMAVLIEIETGKMVDLNDHASVHIEDQVTGKALRKLRAICRRNKAARIWMVPIIVVKEGYNPSVSDTMNVIAVSAEAAAREATARIREAGTKSKLGEKPFLRYGRGLMIFLPERLLAIPTP